MHSWHPFLVHFPIALLVAAFLFHGFQVWKPHLICRLMGLWLLGLATVFSFLAGLTGQREATRAGEEGYSTAVLQLIQRHETLANLTIWGALLILVVWLGLFLRDREGRRVDRLALAFLGLLAAAVVATGLVGGQLVHTHGVGIP